MCKLSLPGNASFQARRKSCTYKKTVERRFVVQLKNLPEVTQFDSSNEIALNFLQLP